MIATTVLAIGIGANCAVSTLIDAVLFRPFPLRHPNELVECSPVAVPPAANFSCNVLLSPFLPIAA
jgi:hypothetical protein